MHRKTKLKLISADLSKLARMQTAGQVNRIWLKWLERHAFTILPQTITPYRKQLAALTSSKFASSAKKAQVV